MHGQPVNSVLEGLLPLHAAASSGSEVVVVRLIEAGADVNAPVSRVFPFSVQPCGSYIIIVQRLPLRYSNEKAKGGTVIVGTSGTSNPVTKRDPSTDR